MTANQPLQARRISLALPLIVAISLTLFLFYIDEGYYSFKWMLSIGNWLVFFIYVSLLLGGQAANPAAGAVPAARSLQV